MCVMDIFEQLHFCVLAIWRGCHTSRSSDQSFDRNVIFFYLKSPIFHELGLFEHITCISDMNAYLNMSLSSL